MDLSDAQLRVLGCLLEKQATTPAYYPMTINALVAGCNQTTSRRPVVSYDGPTVEDALTQLRGRGLVRAVHAPGQRSIKYRQALDEALDLSGLDAAVLAVLMLRGPQTAGELRTRTARYHEFETVGDVERILDSLSLRSVVERLTRGPGEKEDRYRHLLGDSGEPTRPDTDVVPGPVPPEPGPDLEWRLAAVEESLAGIRRDLDSLARRLPRSPGPETP